MKIAFPTRLAEIFFALIMAFFGVLHLKYGSGGIGVPSYLPGNPSIWMYISGIGFLLAAISILLNKFKKTGCYLLALMLFVFILLVHLDDILQFKNLYQPLKDGALAMAAIMIGNHTNRK